MLKEAACGVDTILHLAACSSDKASFDELIDSNVRAVYSILEVARQAKVKRVILASSIHAGGIPEQGECHNINTRTPRSLYGCFKLHAEDLGQMYSRLHGLTVIAVRLGWYPRSRREMDEVRDTMMGNTLYLSHRDANECFLRCLQQTAINSGVIYAVSKDGAGTTFEMNHTKQIIDWEPRDSFPDGVMFDV